MSHSSKAATRVLYLETIVPNKSIVIPGPRSGTRNPVPTYPSTGSAFFAASYRRGSSSVGAHPQGVFLQGDDVQSNSIGRTLALAPTRHRLKEINIGMIDEVQSNMFRQFLIKQRTRCV